MQLSESITDRRADRLDEWSMDELARNVAALESCIETLRDLRVNHYEYIEHYYEDKAHYADKCLNKQLKESNK